MKKAGGGHRDFAFTTRALSQHGWPADIEAGVALLTIYDAKLNSVQLLVGDSGSV